MPIGMVRKLIGADKIIGMSAGTIEEAVQAESDGADYIGGAKIFIVILLPSSSYVLESPKHAPIDP